MRWNGNSPRNFGGLFREVGGSFEVPAEEVDLAFYIPFEQGVPLRIAEPAVDTYRGCPSNRGDLASSLTPLLESLDVGVQHNRVRTARSIAVAIAINVFECALPVELLNQVLVKRHPKFGWQLHFVGLDHFYLDPDRLLLSLQGNSGET